MTSLNHRRACGWALALCLGGLALARPACAADEALAAADAEPAPAKLPKDRCPTMPVPAVRGYLPDGDHIAKVRFLLKADGSVTQVRVSGRAPKPFLRAVDEAVTGYRCQPGATDLDIATEFKLRITSNR